MGSVVPLFSSLLLLFLLIIDVSHGHKDSHDSSSLDTERTCGEYKLKLSGMSKKKYEIREVGCWIRVSRNNEDDDYFMSAPRIRAVSKKAYEKLTEEKDLCEISNDKNRIYYTCLNDNCEKTATIDIILDKCESRFAMDFLLFAFFVFTVCACLTIPCLLCYCCRQYYKIEKDRKRRTAKPRAKKTDSTHTIATTLNSSGENVSNPNSVPRSSK